MDLRSLEHLFHAIEVLGIIVPSFFLCVICTTLSAALVNRPHKILKNICLDYMIMVLPVMLYCTVLNRYVAIINIAVLISTIFVIFIFQNGINDRPQKDARRSSHSGDYKPAEESKVLKYITNTRSIINLITVVAILAVDFSIFPGRYHKTARYGVSLMDVGVGLYVFGNGIVACEIRGVKHSIRKTFVNVLPILVIGVLRFVSTYLTHYNVNVHEYGVHWNFFITLAVTKLLSAVLMTFISPSFKSCVTIGALVIAVHQLLLSLGVEDWVFSDVGRDNLFTANREGIVSSFGYVGLYFVAVATGFIIHASKSKSRAFWMFLSGNIVIICMTIILHEFFNISRCLANSTYILWILLIAYLMTFLLFCYEQFLNVIYTNHEAVVYCPLLFEAINYNGLVYFLAANLITGGINLSIDTQAMNTEVSLFIIMLYMMTNSLIVVFLFTKKIKLKL